VELPRHPADDHTVVAQLGEHSRLTIAKVAQVSEFDDVFAHGLRA
jgi:hypothetical protein